MVRLVEYYSDYGALGDYGDYGDYGVYGCNSVIALTLSIQNPMSDDLCPNLVGCVCSQ